MNALNRYHKSYGAYPAAYSVDEDGNQLLSWRVHLLPFLGEDDLYQRFNFDEPWDSSHNTALIARMPAVYESSAVERGKTIYLGNATEGGVFVPPPPGEEAVVYPQGTSSGQIRDGTSNTIAVVEASAELAVTWTQPSDYVFEGDDVTQGLGSDSYDFVAAFCFGEVRVIKTIRLDEKGVKNIKSMFTRDGREVIEF